MAPPWRLIAHGLNTMSSLIDQLPGVSLPIADVNQTLRHMWDAAEAGVEAEPHAMQLNLVLHFGPGTTEAEATRIFDEAVRFAQRYPSRIVVLCPGEAGEGMRGKLFSQCYLGPNLRDVCCIEAIIVSQPDAFNEALENQASLWLETDLPTYHWLHRIPAEQLQNGYLAFIERGNRIVYDGQIEGQSYRNVRWSPRTRVRDMAYARSLPMRQGLGQFLSAFAPEALTSNFQQGIVRAKEAQLGLAHNLAMWMECCLAECGTRQGLNFRPDVHAEPAEDDAPADLEVSWQYGDHHRFLRWDATFADRTGHLACNFGSGKIEQPFHLECLESSGVLAEALFF